MAIFDFIGGEDFRNILESDYGELKVCVENGAWKAAHVMAGSIIEAILVDYLIERGYLQTSDNNLDHIGLHRLIEMCAQGEILSVRTVHISHAIKLYRNMIHPVNHYRSKENADKESASIVLALVKMVIKEVSANKHEKYGYTAEQIVAKIENDSSSTAILSHLLRDTNVIEKERLLLEIIPQRYIYFMNSGEAVNRVLLSLSECFRQIYEAASVDVKRNVAKALIKVVKEESEHIAYAYEVYFFRATDFEYYSDEDRDLVIQHLFSNLKKRVSRSLLIAMIGIGKYLTKIVHISTIFDILIKTYAFGVYDAQKADIKFFIMKEYSNICSKKIYEYRFIVEIIEELFRKYSTVRLSDQSTFDKLENLKNNIFDPYFEDEEGGEDQETSIELEISMDIFYPFSDAFSIDEGD